MDRNEVARVLEEIAAMLELKGDDLFKVRAYDAGARAIRGFSGDLEEAVRTRELLKVSGIGKGLFSNIETLVTTGALPYYEELRVLFPPGLRECLRIPGFGARKAKLAHAELGIDSVDSLERACREGRIAALKGFGPATQERILRGIEMLRTTVGLHRYSAVRSRAEDIVSAVQKAGLASRIEVAGSLRRRREVVGNINLVAASNRPAELMRTFPDLSPGVAEVVSSGDGKVSLRLAEAIAVDLRVVPEDDFAAALVYFTGSKDHNVALAALAKRKGGQRNAYGLPGGATEGEIYGRLGLQFVPPELREGTDEIEAAARGEIPKLLEPSDVRGLIHVHTTESDGRATLEEMVAATRDAGYEWVAITDHSPTAAYAGGLTPDRVRRQRQAIDALRDRFPGFRIFHGTEADILADGSIDFGDEFLGFFDLVVASVHSRFGMPRDEQTKRLARAVGNPLVSVLGHPTGRLLLTRKGVDADMETVLAAALESGCAVEINGSPHRLDVDWRLASGPARRGMTFSLGPDAHSVRELDNTDYAVGIARKSWVTAAGTLNSKTADELTAWLEKRRGAPLPR